MISRLAAAGLRCYAAVLLLLLPAMLHADALEQKSARRKHEMVLSRPTPKWDKPTEAAEQWDYAMPTGNGRVGALVFGNITNETILLNHDSLFLRTAKPTLPDVSRHVPQLRQMVSEGRYDEAAGFFQNKLQENYDHRGSDSYHPAFNLTVDMPFAGKITDERRVVDFETGEAVVTWRQDDVGYERRVFVSRRDDVVVLRLRATKPGMINARIGLLPTGGRREELGDGKNVRVPRFPSGRVAKIKLTEVPITFNLTAQDKRLALVGKYNGGGPYHLIGGGEFGGCARALVNGGSAGTTNLQVNISGADEALVIIKLFANEASTAATSRVWREIEQLKPNYDELLNRHTALHRELFLRVQLDLRGREKHRSLANEKLVNEVNHGQGYNALFERMFDFGRFALICSSGTNGMPANLQGIWNGLYAPPWASDYHTDINVQMNYFQALPGNLAEITLPYFDYYESLLGDFHANARNIYGCRGILACLGGTSHGLANPGWTEWTAGAGWLAQLFYDYWLHTGDREFLQKRAVPFLKEVALFYEDFLVEGNDGRYVFITSMSPENAPANRKNLCAINATMDLAVAHEVLGNLCAACETLGIEPESVSRWRQMLVKLPPYLVNAEGALKEWAHPDFADNYEHRHMSHLYPVFPGLEITRERDARLFEASRVAMARKMSDFEHPCTWSYVLAACVFARLEQGDEALEALKIVARGYTLPNLFTTLWLFHPLPPMMQFEACSGIPAAMMEVLLSSEPGQIKLLPALPKGWPDGQINGLRARGGFEVDISWRDGRLTSVEIRSLLGNSCRVRYRTKVIELETRAGRRYLFNGDLEMK